MLRNGTSGGRPFGRAIACVIVLLLAGLAAVDMPVAYLPAQTFPELRASLSLPEALEIEEVTRRFLLPIEQAARSLGGVRAVAGTVRGGGADLRVRLEAGVDPGRKSARLLSELARVRRELPRGAFLRVWPRAVAAGDRAGVLWLDVAAEERLDPAFVDAVQALPSVRAVTVAGERGHELRVTAGQLGADPAALERTILQGLGPRRLGTLERTGRRERIVRAAATGDLAELPVLGAEGSVLPLRSLATLAWVDDPPPWQVRHDGHAGRALFLEREHGRSPLELRREVLGTAAAHGLGERSRLVLDEATPIARLLARCGVGLAAAALLGGALLAALGGGQALLGGLLVVPTLVAGALLALRLAGHGLDATTATPMLVAVAAGLAVAAERLARGRPLVLALATTVGAALVPVSVTLVGGPLASLLSRSAGAFPLAVGGSALVALLPPLPAGGRSTRSWANALTAASLRHGGTLVLAAATASTLVLLTAGAALEPRFARLQPPLGDLTIDLVFAEGGGPATATEQVRAVEQHVAALPGVTEQWAFFDEDGAFLAVSLEDERRTILELRRAAADLRRALAPMPFSWTVAALDGSEEDERLTLSDDLESRARTDEEATTYRIVLRSTELEPLREAESRVLDRLQQVGLRRHLLRSGWGRPTPWIELAPRSGTSRDAFAAAARALGDRLRRRPAHRLPGERERTLRIVTADGVVEPDQVGSRDDLATPRPTSSALDEGIAPLGVARVVERRAAPAVRREAGRFVLPLTATLGAQARGLREGLRGQADAALRTLDLPAGVEMERPDLSPVVWEPERLRLLLVAACLPLLLLAFAMIGLDSTVLGLGALLPGALGLAAVCVALRTSVGSSDELTLLAVAAALCVALPIAFVVLPQTAAPTPAAVYRRARERLLPLTGAGLLGTLLLVVPGVGLDAERHAWVLPLRAAGVAWCLAIVGAVVLLPSIRLAQDRARALVPQDVRRRARPPAWEALGEDPAALRLATRNLTKVYAGGVRALSRATFELGPGIVGVLGRNGAGKTTLLRLLCGLLEPSRGQVLLQGLAVTPANRPAYRRLVGFLPQSFHAYDGLSAERFLDLWALERGLEDRRERRREVERVLALVDLEEEAQRWVRDFSGGMRRRIGIARALLGSPPVVIVDEPTTGLDVESRARLRQTLLAAARSRIILFSTHLASDIQAAAGRILVLQEGLLLFDGAAEELVRRARGRVFAAEVDDAELRALARQVRITTRVRHGEALHVRMVVAAGEPPAGVHQVEPNLEEAYLALTGRFERDHGHDAEHGYAKLLDLP